METGGNAVHSYAGFFPDFGFHYADSGDCDVHEILFPVPAGDDSGYRDAGGSDQAEAGGIPGCHASDIRYGL